MSQRDTKLSIHVTDIEKKQIEALAEIYDCSQAAAGRMLFTNAYNDIFGEIHPEALERHDVDVDALVRGEIGPDEVDDELKMDADEAPKVPAADGGMSVSVSPSSHSATETPHGLAKAGPQLSWDELREAVKSHWNDEFTIHPDRVGTDVLKSSREMSAKILAAVLRSEEDVIVDRLIEDRIEDYLGHQIDRPDDEYDEALQWKISRYKPLIVDHLEAHPGTRTDLHFASPEAAERGLPSFVTNTLESLQESQHVLAIDEWADEKDLREDQIQGKEIELWLEALADFRHDLLDLKRVYKDPAFIQALIDSDIDYPEDSYQDPVKWLKAVCESWRDQYADVEPLARYAAVHTVGETDDALLESEIDGPAEAVSRFDGGEKPRAQQFAAIRDAVV